ncbi:MAG: response regulator [Catenulispora sp.]|nr:response regulator [Catenulispora sp.]
MIATIIVDDDPVARAVLTRFVEQAPGFRVVATASSVREAYATVIRQRPQLALLDIGLPDGSGLDLAARLRAEGRAVDVVMVTGRDDPAAVRAALYGGARHYLVKPVRLPALTDFLDHYRDLNRRLTEDQRLAKVSQEHIDGLFGALRRAPAPLPKGLNESTLAAVRAVLRETEDVSADEVVELLGVSRPTAGRYLEHLVRTGAADVELRYGRRGRPQRRYRACPAPPPAGTVLR